MGLFLQMERDLCVSVSVCVSNTLVSRAETAEAIEILRAAWTLVGQRNHILHGSPHLSTKRSNFGATYLCMPGIMLTIDILTLFARGNTCDAAYRYEYCSHGRQHHWNIGGSQVERRRRENWGAVGGEGVGFGDGLCPFPENLWIFHLKMAWYGALWVCCF